MSPGVATRSSAKAPERAPIAAGPSRLVILLGPQARVSSLGEVLREHGLDGGIATVTAGWQEREDEIQALQAHLGGRSENLRLYHRAERLFAADSDLLAIHHERQGVLRELQSLYVLRLDHAMATLADLARRQGDHELLEDERAAVLEDVRRLDRAHLERIRDVHREFDARLALAERPSLARARREVARTLERCDALAIAGGHVATLLNRLELFGIAEVLGEKPVVGWSAGAMVLTERIVVYHDRPPQGFGNSAVFEAGLGLVRGVVAFPDAKTRLRLGDRDRVGRLSRRFAPDSCLALDDGSRLSVTPEGITHHESARVMRADGTLREMSP